MFFLPFYLSLSLLNVISWFISPDAQFLLEQSIAKAVTKGMLLNKRMRAPNIKVRIVMSIVIIRGRSYIT